MHDSQADSALPPDELDELKESLPESQEAKLETTEVTNADSTQALTTSANNRQNPALPNDDQSAALSGDQPAREIAAAA